MLLMFGVGLHFSLDDLLAVRGIALARRGRADRASPRRSALRRACCGAGARRRASCSVWRCRWRARSCCCGRSKSAACSIGQRPHRRRLARRRGPGDGAGARAAAASGGHGSAARRRGRPRRRQAAGLERLWRSRSAKVAAFVVLMLVVGRRVFPWLLWQVARTGSRELFTLCVIAAAVGIAYGAAALFGVSFALGAFFAGMVLRESALSHRAAERVAAAAGRLLGAVLRLGRHAVRSRHAGSGAAARARRRRDHHGRQDAGRLRARACLPLSAQHGADGRRRAWRRSASSRSSWPASACRSACCRRKGRA